MALHYPSMPRIRDKAQGPHSVGSQRALTNIHREGVVIVVEMIGVEIVKDVLKTSMRVASMR